MDSTESLQGTLFSWAYNFFRISGDEELIYRMTLIAIVYTVVVGIFSIFKPAPYGRYCGEQAGFTISATTSWIVSLFIQYIFCIIRNAAT